MFASVGDAEVDSGVPHFESKARIEEHLKASGLEYTFLRPTFFMENFDKDASSLGLYAAALEGHKMQSKSRPALLFN